MKKFFLFCALLIASAAMTQQAAARGTILYGNGPEFQQMYDLPDSLTSEAGNPLEFGVGFEQFSLFYVPIWNYGDTEYAVYDAETRTIYSLDEEDVEAFKQEYGWELPEKPGLSFWNRIGGKLILLVVLAAVVAGWLMKNRESGEDAAATADAK